jgi:hypothetical protein
MACIFRRMLATLVITALIFSVSAASDSKPWIPPQSQINPGSQVWPAMSWLSLAPMKYWVVYERWPERWQDVVDAGFVTQPLYDLLGQVIQPDDDTWSFPRNVHYSYQGTATPLLVTWYAESGETSAMMTARSTVTWEQVFANVSGENQAVAVTLAGNKDRQRQMSICGLIDEGACMFYEAYGRVPESYAELAESGLGPLAPGTLNPLTGKPYAGLGEPNDFYFACGMDDASKHTFKELSGAPTPAAKTPKGPMLVTEVYPLDDQGQRFWHGSL